MQAGVSPKLLIFIGLTAIEVCLTMLLQFSPQTSRGEILHMLYFRGFAMAFLFVPINSSILSQFNGVVVGQVAGLLNLCRQIGGSLGIALIATMLTVNSKQNYLDLASHVTLLDSSTYATYMQSTGAVFGKFAKDLGLADGTDFALRSIVHRVENQAFMLSFIQLVWVIMFCFAVAYIPLYLLKFKKKAHAVMDAH